MATSRGRSSHVWLGTETGILKGVDLSKKCATNHTDISTLSRDQEICCLCWGDDDERQVVLGCRNGTVKTFDSESATFVSERDCSGGDGPFSGIALWDSALVTCRRSGLLKVWKEDESENVEVNVGAEVWRMRARADKRHVVATGGRENDLKIWDLQRPEEPIFRAKNVRNDWLDLRVAVWIRDLQFMPGTEKLVTCTAHHQVRIYDPSCPQRRPVFETTFDEYPLTAVSIMSSQNQVVIGNTHGSMAIIDLRKSKGSVSGALKGQAGSVTCIQCHPSLPLVASCGLDRYLRIHNLDTRKMYQKVYLKSRLNCLLFTSKDYLEQEAEEEQTALPKEDATNEDDLWATMEEIVECKASKKTNTKSTTVLTKKHKLSVKKAMPTVSKKNRAAN
ncbi:WD repeat-containing protein 74 isoform X1 [Petromyzon marinus]|uniref:WD repeat-containing protein 74 n=1 Tax=Petromyzon marinus TaxID=7757 RepID=A0AAJ7SQR8_PETMA|nr:WD repeat-containing protein 74 isoform X1 [Petromyzon marinus]